jgi:transposase
VFTTVGSLQINGVEVPLTAHQIALQEMFEAVRLSKERVERLEKTIEEFVPNWSLPPMVRALQALRGIDLIVAVIFHETPGQRIAPLDSWRGGFDFLHLSQA